MGDKGNRNPSRDYQALADGPWTLWDLMYTRRSVRKYDSFQPDERFVEEMDRLMARALATRGAPGDGIIRVTDQDVGERLRRCAHAGIAHKINLWLARYPVNTFLVPVVPASDLMSERPVLVPRTAMAVEDCVLWLTERGMGTCWLGDFNERAARDVLSLDEDMHVPALVCFGKAGKGRLPGYDDLTVRILSRRRKPLGEVASTEAAGRPYPVRPVSGETFKVSAHQDIERLLGDLDTVPPGVQESAPPLDLAIEACLESARIAPNGGNLQAWQFVAVTDGAKLEELKTALPPEARAGKAARKAAVVAAGKVSTMASRMWDKPYWLLDVPIALSHMSLMAASIGMDAGVWIDGVDEKAINRLAGLPDGWRTLGVMTLG